MNAPASVRELFSSLNGKVCFQPIHGNLGDELIVMGIQQVAKDCGLELTSDIKSADHLLIKGGGALLDVYPKLLREFKNLFEEYSSTPTTFLPTSYLLNSTDMGALVGSRTAPLHIFAREQYSYDLLKQIKFDGPVSLSMDHDTAFHLQDAEFISRLKQSRTKDHILIVERIDPEALTNASAFREKGQSYRTFKSALRSAIPKSLYRSLASLRQGNKRTAPPEQSLFAMEAYERIISDYPESKGLPTRALDVSHEKCCDSMDEFAKIISQSAVVYSSRLHVGILSAMLGIPTYLVEGVYHKIRGIHEYSMSEMDHVTMIPSR